MVRNMPRELGELAQLEFVAMDIDWVDSGHVRCEYRAYRRLVRILRGELVHPQSLLHFVQFGAMYNHHSAMRPSCHPGVES